MTSKFLPIALKAVKNAEKILLKHYHGNQGIKLKADHSPVTLADKGAEKIIVKTIRQVFPDHGFLGEEYGEHKGKSEYVWIIDPIDGTKNYTRHVPMFGTLLALAKSGKIILGVSNVPEMKELMFAEKGRGAYLNDQRVKVSKVSSIEQAYLSIGSINNFYRKKLLNNILKLCLGNLHPRSISDLWAYHLVAQGKGDIVIENNLHIWDIAAPAVIIEEAGGKATDLKGRPITLSSVDIVATNKILHKKVLGFFI